MSLPTLPHQGSRRELRKAVIRLRLELHRQELRHESLLLTRPLRQIQGLARELPDSLGIPHAPLWGLVGVGLLGFLLARTGDAKHWTSLGRRLYRLLLINLRPPRS